MADSENRPIVVGTDGTPGARAAIRRAAVVAVSRDVHLHVVCAHRLSDSGLHRDERRSAPSDVSGLVTPRHEAAQTAAEGVELARSLGAEATAHAVLGGPAWALRDVASHADAGLIVVGAPRRRSIFAATVTPSVAKQLTLEAPCSLVVVDKVDGPIVTGTPNARRSWGLGHRARRSTAA